VIAAALGLGGLAGLVAGFGLGSGR
jgi:hypothetical protein